MKTIIGSLALLLVGIAGDARAETAVRHGLTLTPVADQGELDQLMEKNAAQVRLRHRAMSQLMKEDGSGEGDKLQTRSQDRAQARAHDGAGDSIRAQARKQTRDGEGDRLQTRSQVRTQARKHDGDGAGMRSALRSQRQAEESLEGELQHRYRYQHRSGGQTGSSGGQGQARKRGGR